MQVRLFWKLGLFYTGLMLVVLAVVDFSVSATLRRASLQSAIDRLSSFAQMARGSPPRLSDPHDLKNWTTVMAAGGAHVTVFDDQGAVLADSGASFQNDGLRAESSDMAQVLDEGEGTGVEYSAALGRELAHTAIRLTDSSGHRFIVRISLPAPDINPSLQRIRRNLWAAAFAMLIAGLLASFLFTRSFARRIGAITEFSHRIAQGDFRPVTAEGSRGVLEDLALAMNKAAVSLSQTMQSLREEKDRSSAILGSMVEGVAVMDAGERLVFCNRAFIETLGVDPARAQGRPLLETVRQPELFGALRIALQSREVVHSEVSLGSAAPRTFALAAAPLPSSASGGTGAAGPSAEKTRGAVIVLHDITELRRLERVRRDFVANVSHELKTPLTAIQGFAETLLAGALGDSKNNRRFVEIIREQSVRLARLTEDLLKLARIEAGKLEIVRRAVNVRALVGDCIESARLRADQKQIELRAELSENFPALAGDADALREVLQNLLENALQYTPPGGRVVARAEQAGRFAVLSVEDNGIGIPESEQQRIFERFYRVDTARSREAGGTGLGLSIARHIVEAHGGRIWVESKVGTGSAFRFTVPLERALEPLSLS